MVGLLERTAKLFQGKVGLAGTVGFWPVPLDFFAIFLSLSFTLGAFE